MDDRDIEQQQESPGRVMYVVAFGDTADEIEMSALDQAREFFGPDRHLAIIPKYGASLVHAAHPPNYRESGKRYYAHITVRAVEG